MTQTLTERIEYARYEYPPRIWLALRHPTWEDSPLGWLFGPTVCEGGGYLADTFTHVDCGCAYNGADYSRFRWWTWALYDLLLSPTKWLHVNAWRIGWHRGHAGGWKKDLIEKRGEHK